MDYDQNIHPLEYPLCGSAPISCMCPIEYCQPLLIVCTQSLYKMRNSYFEPVVSLSQVSKRFKTGIVALSDISFSTHAGEFVTLLGPSGCGKSTVLRLVAGLETPSDGKIHAPSLSESDQHSTAFVFQEATLMPWASVFDNVWLPLRLQGYGKNTVQTKVMNALQNVGLEDFANAYPAQLSGGMKMRASIARALITEPELLLMDEPFSALDDMTRQKLNDDLLIWQKERAVATIFVTHNIAEAVYLSQRVLVMQARPGKVIQEIVIDQPYPRTGEFRTSLSFMQYCRTLSSALMRSMSSEILSK